MNVEQALMKAQAEFPKILKTTKNLGVQGQPKYTPLPELLDQLVPVLRKNGLMLYWEGAPPVHPNGVRLITVLAHPESDTRLKCDMEVQIKPDKIAKETSTSSAEYAVTPQGAGSAITYLRRYGTECLTGVVGEKDDDGNAASGRTQYAQKQPDRQVGVGAWCKRNFPTKEGFEMFQSACKEKGKDWKTVARENPNANGAEIMELVESL